MATEEDEKFEKEGPHCEYCGWNKAEMESKERCVLQSGSCGRDVIRLNGAIQDLKDLKEQMEGVVGVSVIRAKRIEALEEEILQREHDRVSGNYTAKELRDSLIAGSEEAEARAGEMEKRYDKLTVVFARIVGEKNTLLKLLDETLKGYVDNEYPLASVKIRKVFEVLK